MVKSRQRINILSQCHTGSLYFTGSIPNLITRDNTDGILTYSKEIIQMNVNKAYNYNKKAKALRGFDKISNEIYVLK